MTNELYETLKSLANSIGKVEYFVKLACCCIKDGNPHRIQDIYRITGVREEIVELLTRGCLDIHMSQEPHELLITLLNAMGDKQ